MQHTAALLLVLLLVLVTQLCSSWATLHQAGSCPKQCYDRCLTPMSGSAPGHALAKSQAKKKGEKKKDDSKKEGTKQEDAKQDDPKQDNRSNRNLLGATAVMRQLSAPCDCVVCRQRAGG